MKTFLLSLSPVLFSSCVSITRTKDEKPIPVKFDQAKTAQAFYGNHFLPKSRREFKPEQGAVSIWLALPVQYSRHNSPRKNLNAAIRAADANQDGTLSKHEVSRYQSAKK